MTVRLDLRLNREDSVSLNQFRNVVQGVLFCIVVIYVMTSAVFFVLSIQKLSLMREKRAALTMEAETALLDFKESSARIKKAAAGHGALAVNIDFVLSGIPALEFMRELEASPVDNVCVEAVSLTSSGASIQGVSSDDAAVLLFSERIESFRSVRGVSVPSIKADDKKTSGLKRFSINIELAEFRDLLLYSLGESAFDAPAQHDVRYCVHTGMSE